MTVIWALIAIAVLILLAAYLAASETAMMRVSRIRVRYLAEKKERNAEKLERLIKDPDRFLPPLLLMVLTVQLTAASLATWVTTRLSHNAGVGVAVGTAVITAMMFIFGELIPKAAASHDSEKIALRVSRPIAFLSILLRPVAILFELVAAGFLKLFGKEKLNGEMIVRDEGEILTMVTAAEEHDVIEEEEKEMIHSVFEFGDTVVREVMVPRPDMITLPADATMEDAIGLTMEHGFSRIPVYKENLDDIVGVLYAKDLIKRLNKDEPGQRVGKMVRQAYFIPETKRLGELLRELQKLKVHMAIVVDEYGTVVGLVTIEDLLEEIVGEIFDEFDHEVKLVEQVAQKRFKVDARVNMDDLKELLGFELPHEEVDTVGGLVFKVMGKVPVPGEAFVYNGVAFKVEKVRNNRISKVMIEIIGENPEGDKG
ncbi:MAG: hemolysin family protein [Actinobacteria bacterium]|nr:hemolysin family protein [Actinomycetota bacterium]